VEASSSDAVGADDGLSDGAATGISAGSAPWFVGHCKYDGTEEGAAVGITEKVSGVGAGDGEVVG
jgi:hypothetical protein